MKVEEGETQASSTGASSEFRICVSRRNGRPPCNMALHQTRTFRAYSEALNRFRKAQMQDTAFSNSQSPDGGERQWYIESRDIRSLTERRGRRRDSPTGHSDGTRWNLSSNLPPTANHRSRSPRQQCPCMAHRDLCSFRRISGTRNAEALPLRVGNCCLS